MTGGQLKRRREVLGYSQRQLAEAFGVHVMTLSKWERDVLDVPVYIELALKTIERESSAANSQTAQSKGTKRR